MLEAFNGLLEKLMPVLTPISVIIGIVLADHLLPFAFLIPFIFAFMTFSGSLSSSFQALKGAVQKPLSFILILLLLHLIMPLIAWSVGHLFFVDDLTITGLVLATVIPTGITSFIWVNIYKGSIALALSIILIDTILSPFLVPSILSFLVGRNVEIDAYSIMYGLLLMVVIPSFLGMLIHYFTKGRSVQASKKLAPFSKLALSSVVMINGAVVAPFIKKVNLELLLISLTVFVLASIGYLLAWMFGCLIKKDRETKIAMMFTGGMRNISAGAVIAVQYFPPAVAVPVVIGMLFQQILASIFGMLFKRFDKEQIHKINHLSTPL
ncbi:bile acid:sodium symporter family protein [Metabacillus litoralis]|uniref:Bile acid:sodium symporter family protein n=1 Tax=Metabacillus litoralis TaxID=152268 RepID=A0A5C6W740_9BACI|nr:bile acid:sodium symporter family protein [Metabacillus litoralis]TXC91607.1 bile acid:sodium symporter family protein [Metabacillus litoralis]